MKQRKGKTAGPGPAPDGLDHIRGLTPDPQNARKHGARNLEAITAALLEVGAARSIVIDEAGRILAGNATVEAAEQAGITRVQVVDVDGNTIVAVRRTGLTEDQKARLALFDNRAAELADGWNPDVLQALQSVGVSMDGLWSGDELAKLLGIDGATGGRGDPDNVPPPRATDIRIGDLFELGPHRLLCGDSTRDEEVERVLSGRKVDIVFTDPPYGVNVTGKGGDAIAGDISFTAIPLMFDVLDRVLAPQAWCYVCGGQSNMSLYARLFERYFRQLPRIVVWDKGNTAVMRRNGYHSCYEFIYYSFKEGGGGRWFGNRDSDSADDIQRVRVERGDERVHLTQKPVELPRRAIENTCPAGGLVFEPFGGSGSTLIAAEVTSHPAAVIELEPSYCQVIIDRWEAFTGSTATKVGAVAGG